jgi:hypothetical protein
MTDDARVMELREALEAAMPILERLDTLRHIDPNYPALDKARAALAKADVPCVVQRPTLAEQDAKTFKACWDAACNDIAARDDLLRQVLQDYDAAGVILDATRAKVDAVLAMSEPEVELAVPRSDDKLRTAAINVLRHMDRHPLGETQFERDVIHLVNVIEGMDHYEFKPPEEVSAERSPTMTPTCVWQNGCALGFGLTPEARCDHCPLNSASTERKS